MRKKTRPRPPYTATQRAVLHRMLLTQSGQRGVHWSGIAYTANIGRGEEPDTQQAPVNIRTFMSRLRRAVRAHTGVDNGIPAALAGCWSLVDDASALVQAELEGPM